MSVDAVSVGDGEPRPTAPIRFTWQPNSAFEDVTSTNYVTADLETQDVAFTFRGPGITWLTVRGPDQGDAELWVDGALLGTVHNYAPSMQYGVPVKVTGLADAVHTLRIVVPGSSGSFVSVDGWRVH